MKKKKTFCLLSAAILVLAVAFTLFYWVIPTTDYYDVSITKVGSGFLATPMVNVYKLSDFDNDEDAIKYHRESTKSIQESIAEDLSKTDNSIKAEVLASIMNTKHFLVSFTHRRSFDEDDFKEAVKDCYGNIFEIESELEKHGAKAKVYPI